MSEKKSKSIPSSRSDSHQPFGKGLILQIVKEVEAGVSRKTVCASYGMAYSTLTEWMAQYGSDGYHASKKAVYSLPQKRNIVRSVQQGRMTKKEACLAYGVNKRILNAWLLQYKRQEEERSTSKQEDVMIEKTATCHTDAGSQKELAEAKLKIAALETMIDLAEQQFTICIRKKSGAKQ